MLKKSSSKVKLSAIASTLCAAVLLTTSCSSDNNNETPIEKTPAPLSYELTETTVSSVFLSIPNEMEEISAEELEAINLTYADTGNIEILGSWTSSSPEETYGLTGITVQNSGFAEFENSTKEEWLLTSRQQPENLEIENAQPGGNFILSYEYYPNLGTLHWLENESIYVSYSFDSSLTTQDEAISVATAIGSSVGEL